MQGLNFFAETKNGEIVQFYNITFVLDNNLCAWVDKNIIKDIIHNYNANRIVSDNLYIRKEQIQTFIRSPYSFSHSNSLNITGGYVPTGYKFPTSEDIPFYTLRSVWDEIFLDKSLDK